MMKKIIIGILLVLIVFFVGCEFKSKEIEVKKEIEIRILGHQTKEIVIDTKVQTKYYIETKYDDTFYLVEVHYNVFYFEDFKKVYPKGQTLIVNTKDLIGVE